MMIPTPAATTAGQVPSLMTPQFDAHQAPMSSNAAATNAWDSYSSVTSYDTHAEKPPAPALMVASEVSHASVPDPRYQPMHSGGMYQNYTPYQQQQTSQESSKEHGRPACSIINFGFGGRLCHYSQQLQQVKITSVKEFIQEERSQGMIGESLPNASTQFSKEQAMMQAFPGPLSSKRQGQVKSLLQKFFSETYNESACSNSSEKLCTRVLCALIQHCEKLAQLPNSDISRQLATELLGGNAQGGQNESASIGFENNYVNDSPLQTGFQQLDSNEAANQMQDLLCHGKTEEALAIALQGQIWGPALVLANHMGQEKLTDTISAMASSCLVKDSPLERFMISVADSSHVPNPRNASSSSLNSLSESSHQGKGSGFPSGGEVSGQGFGFLNSASKDSLASVASAASSPYMYGEKSSAIEKWEKTLCILTNNRKDWKNLAIKQLGDDILDRNSDIFGAHLCYILGCYEFEPFREGSRLCLVGSNHKNVLGCHYVHSKYIQLSEVYEWLITQQNSQYVSFAFQPYRLMYAFKLLDMGDVVDSAKYCQCVLKGFSGKERLTPELTLCKFVAETLMERLHVYMKSQNIDLPVGGNQMVSKIFNSIGGWLDKGITHIMGDDNNNSGSPQMYQVPQTQMQQQPIAQQPTGQQPATVNTQNAGAQQPKETKASSADKPPAQKQGEMKDNEQKMARTKSGGGFLSNFSRSTFGSVTSLIRSSVNDPSYKQAKLGESENTFFFDKELGVWREKGKDPPKAGGALPPPPTSFETPSAAATPGASTDSAPPSSAPPTPGDTNGAPPPTLTSSRSKRSTRSRYVDTFNTGGSKDSNSKSAVAPTSKFALPTSKFAPPSMFTPAGKPSVMAPMVPSAEESNPDLAEGEPKVLAPMIPSSEESDPKVMESEPKVFAPMMPAAREYQPSFAEYEPKFEDYQPQFTSFGNSDGNNVQNAEESSSSAQQEQHTGDVPVGEQQPNNQVGESENQEEGSQRWQNIDF